jgi:hypothetical protein
LEVSKWSAADRVAGAATLIVLVSLFLPWFSSGGYTADGLRHGYEYLTLILSLVTLTHLASRAVVWPHRADWPSRHDLTLAALTGLSLLLVLTGFLARPGVFSLVRVVTASWAFGAFLALAAAAVAAAAAAAALLAERARRDGVRV